MMSLISALLAASLAGCSTETKTAENYIYGQIDSVNGNDVVLLLAEYNENAESDGEDDKSSEKKKSDDASEDSEKSEGKRKMPDNFDGEMPEGFDPSQFKGRKSDGDSDSESGEKPEGFDPSQFKDKMPEGFDPSQFKGKKSDGDSDSGSGEKPEGFDPSQFEGKMPEGFSKPEDGEMPEGFDPSQFKGKSRSDSSDDEGTEDSESKRSFKRPSGNSSYTLNGESEEIRIPVGTKVTTALGVETDFEVLEEGDIIKCGVETDSNGNQVVTSVQIIEQ